MTLFYLVSVICLSLLVDIQASQWQVQYSYVDKNGCQGAIDKLNYIVKLDACYSKVDEETLSEYGYYDGTHIRRVNYDNAACIEPGTLNTTTVTNTATGACDSSGSVDTKTLIVDGNSNLFWYNWPVQMTWYWSTNSTNNYAEECNYQGREKGGVPSQAPAYYLTAAYTPDCVIVSSSSSRKYVISEDTNKLYQYDYSGGTDCSTTPTITELIDDFFACVTPSASSSAVLGASTYASIENNYKPVTASEKKESHVGAIVGGIVAAFAGFFMIAGGLYYWFVCKPAQESLRESQRTQQQQGIVTNPVSKDQVPPSAPPSSHNL